MARRNRISQVKREREQRKRERQRRKVEKAAEKRERRYNQKDAEAEPLVDPQGVVPALPAEDTASLPEP